MYPKRKAPILSLPIELHAEILSTLSFRDLCSVRLTCPTHCRLISNGEVTRRWIQTNIDRQLVQLHPHDSPTFKHLVEQRRRQLIAEETAELLSGYIEREILQFTLRRLDVYPDQSREELSKRTRAQLSKRLVPLLYTLQHYLGHVGRRFVTQHAVRLPIGERADTTVADAGVFEQYDPDHLLQVHKFWLFLGWQLGQILSRQWDVWSFDRFDRAMRGHRGDAFEEFRLLLVLGNLSTLKTVLLHRTSDKRLRALDEVVDKLTPLGWELAWIEEWENLGFEDAAQFSIRQVQKVLATRLSANDVWVDGATKVLIDKGLLPKNGNGAETGTPWQALDFLCDVAGYDVLQTPPSLLQQLL